MAIIRLGVVAPAANTPTQLAAVLNSHLVSVTIANTSSQASPQCKVDVYVVPEGAAGPSEYAYIVANLLVGVGSAFETFRVALNPNDTIYVKSTIAGTSFSAMGLLQSDEFSPSDLPTTFTNKVISGTTNVLTLDKGATSTRPEAAQVGYVRYNTDFNALEVLTASGWKTVSAS